MHLQEHVLREVVDLGPIGHHPIHNAVHEILVAIDELAKRGVVARPAALDQSAFVEVAHPASSIRLERLFLAYCFTCQLKQSPRAPSLMHPNAPGCRPGPDQEARWTPKKRSCWE